MSVKRRSFIAGAGAALLAAPRIARAQQPTQRLRRLAFPSGYRPVEQVKENGRVPWYEAFHAELRRLGWIENVNLAVEYWPAAGVNRDDYVRQIYGSRPDAVYFAGYETWVPQILRDSGSVPTVILGQDPVKMGIVNSFPHPGGSITGFSVDAGMELAGKLLQLIVESVPGARRIAYFGSRDQWDAAQTVILDAARGLGVTVEPQLYEIFFSLADMVPELRRVFAALVASRPDAMLGGIGAEASSQAQVNAEMSLAARLPAISYFRQFADFGGLMGYGPDLVVLMRRAAGYVDRILRGANAGDLPIQQPEVFEFVINLKTEKSFGITIPDSVKVFATEFIE